MTRRLEAWLAASVLAVLMLYWLVWSVVGPVTNQDSLIYHLARLWLIEQTGLFHNTSYTWITQLILPWTFDAVHYPLLRLRYGYALPSFLCLVGIMGIVFAWVRERGDTLDGLRACLGLLSMPAVVMLATTTKNDLVLAFCLLCWIEALRRYAARPADGPLLFAALALGFLAGSKLTGVLYGGPAAVVSVWVARRRPRDAVWFGVALALMLALNGSGEIYLNNYLQFGHWSGDPEWYRHAANNDGWRGFLANEMRYGTSLLDLQLAPMDVLAWIADVKYRACQFLLQHFHLQGLGLMSPPWRRIGDQDLGRQMATLLYSENRPTYGLIGTLLLLATPLVFIVRRRFDFPAWLFAGGVTAQVIVAGTAGWHPGNLRYFAAAACLAWAGASLLLVSSRRRWALARRHDHRGGGRGVPAVPRRRAQPRQSGRRVPRSGRPPPGRRATDHHPGQGLEAARRSAGGVDLTRRARVRPLRPARVESDPPPRPHRGRPSEAR